MLVNETILTKHAEDAAFLWLQRDHAVRGNHYTYRELARLDSRVDAHFDGLAIARDAGWEICRSQLLEYSEAGEVFAAAVLALHPYDDSRMATVIDLAYRSDETARALVAAIGWHPFERVAEALDRWLDAEGAFENYLGLAGYAVHRRPPPVDLAGLIAAPSQRLARRAIAACAELGRLDLVPHLREVIADRSCGGAAAIALAQLGVTDLRTLDVLFQSSLGGEHVWPAASLLAVVDPTQNERRIQWWKSHDQLVAAIAALESSGEPSGVSELIALMGRSEVARLAGDAFRTVTGIDLALHNLERKVARRTTEDHEIGVPAADGAPSEEVLEWPSELSVARHWRRNQRHYEAGMRYVAGLATGFVDGAASTPAMIANLLEIVHSGRPRQRDYAARALARANPGMPRLATHALVSAGHLLPGFLPSLTARLEPGKRRVGKAQSFGKARA